MANWHASAPPPGDHPTDAPAASAIAAPEPSEQPKDTAATTEPREEAGQPERRRPLSEQLSTVAAEKKLEGLADELDMLGARNVSGFYRDVCTCDECERDVEPRSPWDWF